MNFCSNNESWQLGSLVHYNPPADQSEPSIGLTPTPFTRNYAEHTVQKVYTVYTQCIKQTNTNWVDKYLRSYS